MRVSREQAIKNREHVVDTAAKLFREHGYSGIGVADLMKAAGLTHGGFYGNFGSKEDLMAEACARAFEGSIETWDKLAAKDTNLALEAISAAYLSPQHVANPGQGCAMAALGADVARLSPPVRDALTEGVRKQLDQLTALMPAGSAAEQRKAAMVAYASMVGAMVMARAVNDPALADELLGTVQSAVTAGV
jgi:TetR/AcrR family transcriptional repressor of nem operon